MLAERITLEGNDITSEYEAVESINLMAHLLNPAYPDDTDYPLRESLGTDSGNYRVMPADTE